MKVVVMVMVGMGTIGRLLKRGIRNGRTGGVHSGVGHSGNISTGVSRHGESHNGSTVSDDSNNSEGRFGRHVE